ncbi:hypothetical protein ACFPVT_03330 [Corynebacterium choanae]|uniref:Uncharacterized protein n=1 Tax=Corynebacterium choanae TaxID=1862358 RepID=A0A3G6JA55_9CORY|nr:hypothetical protein [Corynebacterium choanae]AZA14692.1 hypothetical protein CCHOA_11605 [Corynebacterium choanae]
MTHHINDTPPTFDWATLADGDYWDRTYQGASTSFPTSREAAAQLYTAINSTGFYQHMGYVIDLAASPVFTRDADWCVATFSLVYPLLAPGDFTDKQASFTTDLDLELWNCGRFKGFGEIRFSADTSDSTALACNPKAFYQRASHRYPSDFAKTLSTAEVEQLPYRTVNTTNSTAHTSPQSPATGSSTSSSSSNTNDNCRAYHLLVRDEAGITAFDLAEDPAIGSSDPHTPAGRLRLIAVELVEHAKAIKASETTAHIDRFLTMHFVLEGPSNTILERTSEALHRPRNELRLTPSAARAHSRFTDQVPALKQHTNKYDHTTVSVLPYFVELTRELLNLRDGCPTPHQHNTTANTHATRSAPASGDVTQRTTATGSLSTARELFQFQLSRGNNLEYSQIIDGSPQSLDPPHRQPIAYRMVCAVPNCLNLGLPQLLASTDGSTPVESCAPEIALGAWGWKLATGADQYFENIPDITDETGFGQVDTRSRFWSVYSDQAGIAFVRKPLRPATLQSGECAPRCNVTSDPKNYMLVATVFLDLALLAIRSEMAIAVMQQQLDCDMLTSHTLTKTVDSHDVNKLAVVLDNLQLIHQNHLAFRRDLWFESIPGHRFDFLVMQAMIRSRGVKAAYEDFQNELTLHKEILETAFQRQSDLQHAEEQHTREKQNQILGVVATVLAVPAWIELSGANFSVPTLVIGALIAALLAMITWKGLNFLARNK